MPLPCSAGEYSYAGSTVCSTCPLGYYCPTNSTSEPIPCPDLTYTNQTGSFFCQPCPGGHQCSRNATPEACADGYYACSGSCFPCPAGYRCPDASELPVICSARYYTEGSSIDCSPCPKGHFCPTDGLNQSYACPEGYHVTTNGSVTCEPCPAGLECSDPAMNPVPCQVGFYSVSAFAYCLRCPNGTYTISKMSHQLVKHALQEATLVMPLLCPPVVPQAITVQRQVSFVCSVLQVIIVPILLSHRYSVHPAHMQAMPVCSASIYHAL